MTKRHYHVTENTPGYLPEYGPATFTAKRDAEGFARELASSLREAGYRTSGRKGNYYAELPPAATTVARDLGRVVETFECFETDCTTEEDSF